MSAVLQSSDEPILLRNDAGGIATVTLNRPKQYNALSEELLTELQSTLDAIAKDRVGARGRHRRHGHRVLRGS